MVTNEHTTVQMSKQELQHEIKTLTYRHIAWMTALRHAMRQAKPWETAMSERTNQEWSKVIRPLGWDTSVEEALKPYLSTKDLEYAMTKNNKQTAILYLQSHHLRRLKESGGIWEFAFRIWKPFYRNYLPHKGSQNVSKIFHILVSLLL